MWASSGSSADSFNESINCPAIPIPSSINQTEREGGEKKKQKKNKDNVRRHVTTNVDHNGDYSMTCGLKRPSLGRGGSIFQPVEKLRTVLLFRLLIASDVSTHHGGGSLNGCTR